MNAFPCVVCAKIVYDWNKALACDMSYVMSGHIDTKICFQFKISIKQGVNYTEEVELISIPNERDQRLYNRINRVMYNNIHNIYDHNIDDENEPENNMNCKYYSID